MSFSGLKTAVLTQVRRAEAAGVLDAARKADIAREFQHAVVDVLVAKALAALDATGHDRLVVAGGVGADRRAACALSAAAARRGAALFFPDLAFCTDNGAMIALVGALRLRDAATRPDRVLGPAALGAGLAHSARWRGRAGGRAPLAGGGPGVAGSPRRCPPFLTVRPPSRATLIQSGDIDP